MKTIFKAIIIVLVLLILIPLGRLLIFVTSWVFESLEWSGCVSIDPYMILTFVFVAIFIFFIVQLFND